jgi:hypothetical protein
MRNFLINESAISAEPTISKKNKNTVEFIAVMQEADKPNRNGRVYYKSVLEQALQSPYVQERLRTKSMYVESGHPFDTSVQRQMTIDQRNIAAIIKEFWWEGNLLKARLETADTAIGRDMRGLIEQGSRVAFSLRAQGNVHRDEKLGVTVVEAPIQIATYDWVVNPSHDKAFLETICEDTRCGLFGIKESKSLVLNESVSLLSESARLYEEGRLIPLSETESNEVLAFDYTKTYFKKIKPLSEAYVYDPKDILKVDGKFGLLENGNVRKKVMLEDYLLKDIRHRILNLVEKENIFDNEKDRNTPVSQANREQLERLAKVAGGKIGPQGEAIIAATEKREKEKKESVTNESIETKDLYNDKNHFQKVEVEPVLVEKAVSPTKEEKVAKKLEDAKHVKAWKATGVYAYEDGTFKYLDGKPASAEDIEKYKAVLKGEEKAVVTEEETVHSEEKPYKEKFMELLSKYGVKSIPELGEKKSEFFKELDSLHLSKEEKAELGVSEVVPALVKQPKVSEIKQEPKSMKINFGKGGK